MSEISDARLRELIAQHEKLGLTEWVSLGRELLALRERHREAIAFIKELIVMEEGDAELFKQGGAWRPFYLAHADKLRAFLAAEQPAQEKVAP